MGEGVELMVWETNRYAGAGFRYADKSDGVAIENAAREMGRVEEVKKRFLRGRK